MSLLGHKDTGKNREPACALALFQLQNASPSLRPSPHEWLLFEIHVLLPRVLGVMLLGLSMHLLPLVWRTFWVFVECPACPAPQASPPHPGNSWETTHHLPWEAVLILGPSLDGYKQGSLLSGLYRGCL